MSNNRKSDIFCSICAPNNLGEQHKNAVRTVAAAWLILTYSQLIPCNRVQQQQMFRKLKATMHTAGEPYSGDRIHK